MEQERKARTDSRRRTLLGYDTRVRNRDDRGDSYRVGVSTDYLINRRWSMRGGVEYSRLPSSFGSGDGIGFNVA